MSKSLEQKDPAQLEVMKKRHFAFRLNVFFFSTFILFSVLVVRLAYLQFVQVDEMRANEIKTNTSSTPIAPIRGNIFDRNEYALAYTESTQSLFYRYEPGLDRDVVIDQVHRLAKVFEDFRAEGKEPLSANDIIKRMDVGYDIYKNPTKSPGLVSRPRRIKEGLSQREIAYIMEHMDEFRGLDINEESVRKYDTSTIAVQLIGYLREYSTASNQTSASLSRYKQIGSEYLNEEYVGFDGLELLYQDVLRGKNGSKTYKINAQGKIIEMMDIKIPEKGQNLILSLDKDVQLEAENSIVEHLEWLQGPEGLKFNKAGTEAVAGYAVAMEIATGHIVAMASMPDYDPNVWRGGISNADYQEIQWKMGNGTIRERYANLPEAERGKHPTSLVPLGSTVKPLSILLGLNEGLFTAQEKYPDTGVFVYGRDESKIRNAGGGRANGMISATAAIRQSSNVFMSAMVGNRLYMSKTLNGIDTWDSYMKQFGLGVVTGSGLPGESAGDPYYYKTAQESSAQAALVFASFGQQGRYTALQLAQYATTLANEGKRLKPQFVQKITDYEGNVVEEFDEPIVLSDIDISDEHWKTVKAGMQSSVAFAFDGFPYDFRRKTGTSESDIAGKRVENAVFIAYAPAENPKLAVAVVVPEGGFGGWGAAPIARKIFDAYDKKIGLVDKPDTSNTTDSAQVEE
jgi:penicillin-binding protein 2